jgi:DNA-directed RNA polymerase specialized sigma24 family protein
LQVGRNWVDSAVAAAKAGDETALHYLYVRFADDVCAYVRNIVREHGDPENLTQTVFLKLPRAIGRYDSCAQPFERWLLRLARESALEQVTCSSRGETVWVPPVALGLIA